MYKQIKPISNIKLYGIKFFIKNNIVCVSSANKFLMSNYMLLSLLIKII